MRIIPLLAALVLPASQATAQPATAPSALVGTWEPLDGSQRGIGSIMIFAPADSVKAILSVILDARYTRDGNRVQITNEDGNRVDFTVAITGDTLVQTTPDIPPTKMARIARSGPDTGIVGKWQLLFEVPQRPGVSGIVEYTADGMHRLRLSLRTQTGTYSVSGSELTVRFPDTPPQTGAFSIDGDVLALQGPDGTRARFARTR